MKTYIRAMRSNGEDLRLKPRIKVLTLHGSKGGEATNVIILQNQTTQHYQRSNENYYETR